MDTNMNVVKTRLSNVSLKVFGNRLLEECDTIERAKFDKTCPHNEAFK